MDETDTECLSPTAIIDSDNEGIIKYAMDAVRDSGEDPVARAVKLYYAVRDSIRYDPYCPFYLPEHYRASNVLKSGRGYCVSKAALPVPLEGFVISHQGLVLQPFETTWRPDSSLNISALIYLYTMALTSFI